MGIAILVDFGSTYTKVVAADLEEARLLGRAQAPSTVDSDVMVGLQAALAGLKAETGIGAESAVVKLACSSAAGGLRMAAVGLVPWLTAEAAQRAALGAGAKVVRVFCHELTEEEITELETLAPDMLLLAGGTDGGNRETIIHNARAIAASTVQSPVVVAGNKAARREVAAALRQEGQPFYLTDNVMPELNVLDVEPARACIREVFMAHIVEAKGLERARQFVQDIIMPTPMAVLEASRLLARGAGEEDGLGELVVVDVGGATTDIHSIGEGRSGDGAIPRGLPEPYAKRTVEGDLGTRINAPSVMEAAREKGYFPLLHGAAVGRKAEHLSTHIDALPHSEEEHALDVALAGAAVEIAMARHAGHIEVMYTPTGPVNLLTGKDLTGVATFIGTGGVFAFGAAPQPVLEAALYREDEPHSRRPRSPELFIDSQYILYAMGLLGRVAPQTAIKMMKSSLKKLPASVASGRREGPCA